MWEERTRVGNAAEAQAGGWDCCGILDLSAGSLYRRAALLRLSHLLPVTGSPLSFLHIPPFFTFLLPSMIPLSLAAYLLFLSALVSADPIHVNLARRAHGPRNASHYAAIAESVRQKYGFHTAAQGASRRGVHGVLKRASAADISIINQVSDTATLSLNVASSPLRTMTPAIWGR